MKIIHFYHFDSDPRFPPFLLYVRWKSGVTFVRRYFRDVSDNLLLKVLYYKQFLIEVCSLKQGFNACLSGVLFSIIGLPTRGRAHVFPDSSRDRKTGENKVSQTYSKVSKQ